MKLQSYFPTCFLLVLIIASGLLGQATEEVGDSKENASPVSSHDGKTPTEDQKADDETATEENADTALKKDREDYYELLMIFADTIDQVDRNYVEKVSRRELLEAAIDGVLKKLDPYSNYIAPEELADFKVEVENEFGGIGIKIAKDDDGQLLVISPIAGTPAYAAKIIAGDVIREIDGQPTKPMSISDAANLLKGRLETEVRLKVFHPLSGTTDDIVLTRQVIKVETVLGDRRKPDDSWQFMYDTNAKIGYIRITAFGRETAEDLQETLEDLRSTGMKGLILDLRFNPGGLLKSAIEVGDVFLSSGTIVGTVGRNITPKTWSATKEDTFSGFPMAVLANQYSASASEIVAAALQDHKRAVVVGQQTFGKASVQNVVELEDGKSALKITTGSYQRPSGKPIHRFPNATDWGVKPNESFRVTLTDFELAQIMRRRRERDNIGGRTDEEPSSSFDPQIRRALSYLRAEISKRDAEK